MLRFFRQFASRKSLRPKRPRTARRSSSRNVLLRCDLLEDRILPSTLETAAFIGVAPGASISNQTLAAGTDNWFSFQVQRTEKDLTVATSFTPAATSQTATELTRQVTDIKGNILATGSDTIGATTISDALANVAPGTYYAHIINATAAPNAASYNYSISTSQAETYVGVGPGVHLRNQSLSASQGTWYQFQVVRIDNLTVATRFNPATANVSFQVSNAQGTVLANSTSNANGASAALTNLGAGTYYLHVVAGPQFSSNSFELDIDPTTGASSTVVYYVNDGSTAGDTYTTAVGDDHNTGTDPAHPMATVQKVIDTYTLTANSLVVIDTGTYSGATSLNGDDQGAAYAGGAGGSTFTAYTAISLTDCDSNLFFGLSCSGNSQGFYNHGLNGNNSRRNTLWSNTFTNVNTPIEIDGGDSDIIQYNAIAYNTTPSGNYGLYLPNMTTAATVSGNSGKDWPTASGSRHRSISLRCCRCTGR
jgi:hypothetical protein